MHYKALPSELQGSLEPASFPLCYKFGNEKFSNREIFSPSRCIKELPKIYTLFLPGQEPLCY